MGCERVLAGYLTILIVSIMTGTGDAGAEFTSAVNRTFLVNPGGNLSISWEYTLGNLSSSFQAVQLVQYRGEHVNLSNIISIVTVIDNTVLDNVSTVPVFDSHVGWTGNLLANRLQASWLLTDVQKEHTQHRLACGLVIGGSVMVYQPVTVSLIYLDLDKNSSSPSELQVCYGAVNLSCEAIGQPASLQYEWFGPECKSISTQNKISFNLTDDSQLGRYKCVVKSANTSIEHTVNVRYADAPGAPVIESSETKPDSIMLKWSAAEPVTVEYCINTFNVKWKKAGIREPWSSHNTTNETYTITGLTSETKYDIRISAWNKESSARVASTVVFALSTKQGSSPSLSCHRKDSMIILVCQELKNARTYEFVRAGDSQSRQLSTSVLAVTAAGAWRCRVSGVAGWDKWSNTINTGDCEQLSSNATWSEEVIWKTICGVLVGLFVIAVLIIICCSAKSSPCGRKKLEYPHYINRIYADPDASMDMERKAWKGN